MAAKDIYHGQCVRALEKDGWTITHDPLKIDVEGTNVFVDLGAERLVTAERGSERIAVEVKSFVSLSDVQDLKEAAGQYLLYELALQTSKQDKDRELFLAIRTASYKKVFVDGIGKLFMESKTLRLITFDPDTEEVVEWIR